MTLGCVSGAGAMVLAFFGWAVFSPQSRAETAVTACKSNMQDYGRALELYSTDNQGLYPKTGEALVPKYLPKLPQCRNSRSPYVLVTSSEPDRYTIICAGENHKSSLSIPANYPQCTSVRGVVNRPD